MANITDLKKEFYEGITGQRGGVSELELAFLQDGGAVSNNLNDAWREYLRAQGVDVGNNQDMLAQWLKDIGRWTGNINTSLKALYVEGMMPPPIFQVNFNCSTGLDPVKGLGEANFSRATSAQFAAVCADDLGGNPAGTYRTADIDEPRFEKEGYLCEGDAVNLVDTDFGTWTATSGSVILDDDIAPDGSAGAMRFIENSGTGTKRYRTVATLIDGTYTHCVYAKPNGRNIYIGVEDTVTFTNNAKVVININDGSLVSISESGSFSNTTYSVSEALNGYYRVCISGNTGVKASDGVWCEYRPADGGVTDYLGDGNSGFWVWAPNLVALPFATSPIYGAVNTSRLADVNQYQALGNFNKDLFTLELNFDLLGLGVEHTLIYITSTAGGASYLLIAVNATGNVVFYYNGSTLTSTTTIAALTKAKSQCIFDGTNIRLIVNGNDEGSVAATAMADALIIYNGETDTGTNHMYGHMSKPLKSLDYDITNPPEVT